MKRIFLVSATALLLTITTGCHKMQEKVEKMERQQHEHEKMESSREILNAIQEEIAKKDRNLEVVDGVLSDKHTGLAHYEIIPLSVDEEHHKKAQEQEEKAQEHKVNATKKQEEKAEGYEKTRIDKHFNPKDIEEGYILRPLVDSENSRLIIVAHANGKKSSEEIKTAMEKVLSDQERQFKDANLENRHLIKNNETSRQGNFLIYVTWDNAKDLVKIFERHVR